MIAKFRLMEPNKIIVTVFQNEEDKVAFAVFDVCRKQAFKNFHTEHSTLKDVEWEDENEFFERAEQEAANFMKRAIRFNKKFEGRLE